MPLIRRRIANIGAALPDISRRAGLEKVLALFLLFALGALTVGFGTGFLSLRPLAGDAVVLATLPLLLLLKPAFLEETMFRAALIPHPAEGASPSRQWTIAALSLALFVGMHPVNGYFFHRRELELFVNHTFLSLSLLLGIVCTAAYVMTGLCGLPFSCTGRRSPSGSSSSGAPNGWAFRAPLSHT
jgi:predicted Abi (CAAX) family protease